MLNIVNGRNSIVVVRYPIRIIMGIPRTRTSAAALTNSTKLRIDLIIVSPKEQAGLQSPACRLLR
jgi:hypothetical protein